jgi:hypothetical protein
LAHRTFVAAILLAIPSGWAWADCFVHHAARYGLEPELLRAIALVESGGRPDAVNGAHQSRTGTRDLGLMQINSAWLPRLRRHGIQEQDLFEPCTSIEVGAWVLADLVGRHGNTWDAVGAYNAACTQLKGAACIKARARYTWLVHQRLKHLRAGSAKPATAATAVAPTARSVQPVLALPAPPVLVALSDVRNASVQAAVAPTATGAGETAKPAAAVTGTAPGSLEQGS